ncbi:MAG TPA: DUF1416 domain-containing protein [Streptosporangiaceae bacterium]|nr:DUF1416 domain-containing protein [Streptosporangiaceae bacterium]
MSTAEQPTSTAEQPTTTGEQASAAGCGAPAGGVKVTEGPGDQAVVQGRVTNGGTPVGTGYARLLNADGEFVAEVPLGEDGGFTFYAAPGDWKLRVLAPGGIRTEQVVSAALGKVTELEVAV